jgi:hypothetical protein
MRWVSWFYGHFNAQTPHQNAPFLTLLQRNAKVQPANYNNINTLHFCILQFTLTDKANDRETFMKGVDYSYYYEQEE